MLRAGLLLRLVAVVRSLQRPFWPASARWVTVFSVGQQVLPTLSRLAELRAGLLLRLSALVRSLLLPFWPASAQAAIAFWLLSQFEAGPTLWL